MKTYLITGCAGFIGSNFVHYMLKKYPEILLVNLDIISTSNDSSGHGNQKLCSLIQDRILVEIEKPIAHSPPP